MEQAMKFLASYGKCNMCTSKKLSASSVCFEKGVMALKQCGFSHSLPLRQLRLVAPNRQIHMAPADIYFYLCNNLASFQYYIWKMCDEAQKLKYTTPQALVNETCSYTNTLSI
jgi:hypothetical protein